MTEPIDYGFKVIQSQWSSGMLTYNQINAGGRTFDTRDVIDTNDYLGYSDLIISSTYAPIISVSDDKFHEYAENINKSKRLKKCSLIMLLKLKLGNDQFVHVVEPNTLNVKIHFFVIIVFQKKRQMRTSF